MIPVRLFYNLLITLSWPVLGLVALFNTKIGLFVGGRKKAKHILKSSPLNNEPCIWMHVASLGEYEQGLPILEKIRAAYPSHKLVLTFFSPSGYEVKKDTNAADLILYLPMDTHSNAKMFLDQLKPELAIFIKYEIWPNYLRQLEQRNIPTLLVSAIFSKRQIFFKPWGGFMRKSLKAFTHFFVQDQKSQELLKNINYHNVSISGDTRFDRVSEILQRDNQLGFMDSFKNGQCCLVAGSTWAEDEEILMDHINSSSGEIKYVLAPHTIKPAHVERIKAAISKKVVCFSKIENKNLGEYEVLIIDTIGLLTKIYSYANIAYVGGAFATGLHNTLEPAVYGIPVIIGPDYHGFKEAEDLVNKGGIHVITHKTEFRSIMDRLTTDSGFAQEVGAINSSYIQQNVGATEQVLGLVKTIL